MCHLNWDVASVKGKISNKGISIKGATKFLAKYWRWISLSCILLTALGFGLGKYYLSMYAEDEQTKTHFDRMSQNAFSVLSNSFTRAVIYPELMAQMLFTAGDPSNLTELSVLFSRFGDTRGWWRNTVFLNTALVKRVTPAEKLEIETFFNGSMTQWTPSGVVLANSSQSADFYPIIFVEPYKGNEASWLLDVSTNPDRLPTIDYSRTTGNFSVSARFILVQSNRVGLSVQIPLFRDSSGALTHDSTTSFWGMITAALDLNEVLNSGFVNSDFEGMDVFMYDLAASSSKQFLAVWTATGLSRLDTTWLYTTSAQNILADPADLIASFPLPMGQRTWLVVVRARQGYIKKHETLVPLIILMMTLGSSIVGQLFVLLAGLVAWLRSRRRAAGRILAYKKASLGDPTVIAVAEKNDKLSAARDGTVLAANWTPGALGEHLRSHSLVTESQPVQPELPHAVAGAAS